MTRHKSVLSYIFMYCLPHQLAWLVDQVVQLKCWRTSKEAESRENEKEKEKKKQREGKKKRWLNLPAQENENKWL